MLKVTGMPKMTRQHRWQEKRISESRCAVCGKPINVIVSARYCLKHLIERREWQRRRSGSKKRYRSLSYRLAEQERNNKVKP